MPSLPTGGFRLLGFRNSRRKTTSGRWLAAGLGLNVGVVDGDVLLALVAKNSLTAWR